MSQTIVTGGNFKNVCLWSRAISYTLACSVPLCALLLCAFIFLVVFSFSLSLSFSHSLSLSLSLSLSFSFSLSLYIYIWHGPRFPPTFYSKNAFSLQKYKVLGPEKSCKNLRFFYWVFLVCIWEVVPVIPTTLVPNIRKRDWPEPKELT